VKKLQSYAELEAELLGKEAGGEAAAEDDGFDAVLLAWRRDAAQAAGLQDGGGVRRRQRRCSIQLGSLLLERADDYLMPTEDDELQPERPVVDYADLSTPYV
jgi:hypothetical protein